MISELGQGKYKVKLEYLVRKLENAQKIGTFERTEEPTRLMTNNPNDQSWVKLSKKTINNGIGFYRIS